MRPLSTEGYATKTPAPLQVPLCPIDDAGHHGLLSSRLRFLQNELEMLKAQHLHGIVGHELIYGSLNTAPPPAGLAVIVAAQKPANFQFLKIQF